MQGFSNKVFLMLLITFAISKGIESFLDVA